ncbi:MAG: hypothetical protein FJX89_09110 [Bacteroidetes bacterium]|nr:hypothetical protein [Bacteroidota bacterium]
MQKLEEVKINAYLSPHPLDDDSFLEEEWISWLPGYIKGETEDGLPSYLSDSNIALYVRIENFTVDLFKSALSRMWPLLKEYHYKSLNISIDYSNYKMSSSLAGYQYKYSNPGKGIYFFSVDQKLLSYYSAFIDKKVSSLPEMNLWEHELMHAIDHWNILKASSLAHSNIPLNNLQYYFIKYREEGIANLLDLMDGKINGINSRTKAKEVLANNYAKIKMELSTLEKTDDKIRSEIYSGYDFYEVGPWIMLDLVNEIFSLTDDVSIMEVERKIANGEENSEELKFEIIRHAFLFDTDMFLSRLDNYCEA